jgi:hypothetical protein
MMAYGGMGGLWVVYAILWILVVGTIVVALWRGMQAQEKMARHLEATRGSSSRFFQRRSCSSWRCRRPNGESRGYGPGVLQRSFARRAQSGANKVTIGTSTQMRPWRTS